MNTKLELLLGTSSTCLPVIQTSSALSLCVDGPEGFSPDPGFLPDAALSVRLSLFGSMEVFASLGISALYGEAVCFDAIL